MDVAELPSAAVNPVALAGGRWITTPGTGTLDLDRGRMSARAIISTIDPDREGDVILPQGCKGTLDNYRRAPVVCFGHREDYPLPVGSSADPIAGQLSLVIRDDKDITATCWFSQKTQFATDLYGLVDEGLVKMASIGLRPIVTHRLREKRSEGDHGTPEDPLTAIPDWELLEWSWAVIAVNPYCEMIRAALSNPAKKLDGMLRKALGRYAQPAPVWSPGWRPPDYKAMGTVSDTAGGVLVAPDAKKDRTKDAALPAPVAQADPVGGPQEAMQCLWFPKATFLLPDNAEGWILAHGFSAGIGSVSGNYWVFEFFPRNQLLGAPHKVDLGDGVVGVSGLRLHPDLVQPLPGEQPSGTETDDRQAGLPEVAKYKTENKGSAMSTTMILKADKPLKEDEEGTEKKPLKEDEEGSPKEKVKPDEGETPVPKEEDKAAEPPGKGGEKPKPAGDGGDNKFGPGEPLPHGGQTIMDMVEHIQVLKEYLEDGLKLQEDPDIKSRIEEDVEAMTQWMAELKDLGKGKHPGIDFDAKPQPAMTPDAAAAADDGSMGADDNAVVDNAVDEEPMPEKEGADDDEEADEKMAAKYRAWAKGIGRRVQVKAKGMLRRHKAVCQEAAEHMSETAAHGDMPKIFKAGHLYHANQLMKAVSGMDNDGETEGDMDRGAMEKSLEGYDVNEIMAALGPMAETFDLVVNKVGDLSKKVEEMAGEVR